MIEGERDDIVIIRPSEHANEWFVVPVDRASLCRWLVAMYSEHPEQAILAKLATVDDETLRAIAVEHACIEYNKLRWGYDVRWVRPN